MGLPALFFMFPPEVHRLVNYSVLQAAFIANPENKKDWRKWHAGVETFRDYAKRGLVGGAPNAWHYPTLDAGYDALANEVPIPEQNLSASPGTMYDIDKTGAKQKEVVEYQKALNSRYSQSWKLYYPVNFPNFQMYSFLRDDAQSNYNSDVYKPDWRENPAWRDIQNVPQIPVNLGVEQTKKDYKKYVTPRKTPFVPENSPYNARNFESLGQEKTILGS